MVLKAFEKKTAEAKVVAEVKKPLMEKKAPDESGGLDSGEAPVTCKWCEKGTCWKKDCPNRAAKKSSQPCRFFAKSECKQGEACPYKHDLDAGDLDQIDYCVFFSKGKCTKGDACTFNHDFDPEDPEVQKTMKERQSARATAFSEGPKGKGKGKGKGKWGYESYDDGAAQALGAILALALAGDMGGGWGEESWEEPAHQQVKGGSFGKGGKSGLKTRLCNQWQSSGGFCPRGGSCTFAHGEQELGSSQGAGGMTHLGDGIGGRMMVGGNSNPNPAQRRRMLEGGDMGGGMTLQQQASAMVAGRLNTKGGGKGAGRLDAALAAGGGACKWCQQGQCWTHGVASASGVAAQANAFLANSMKPQATISSADVAAQANAFLMSSKLR